MRSAWRLSLVALALYSLLLAPSLLFAAKKYEFPLVRESGSKGYLRFVFDDTQRIKMKVGSNDAFVSLKDIESLHKILKKIDLLHRRGDKNLFYYDIEMGRINFEHYKLTLYYDNKFRKEREIKFDLTRSIFGKVHEQYTYYMDVSYIGPLLFSMDDLKKVVEKHASGEAEKQKQLTEKVESIEEKVEEITKIIKEEKNKEKQQPSAKEGEVKKKIQKNFLELPAQ